MTEPYEISEQLVRINDHEMFYLAAGPEQGTPVIFSHGWPELGYSWRHQLPALGALGFHAIAPDLRGHGRSASYDEHADYSMEKHVGDLIGLLDKLGHERAIWVGHDWGAPVIWSLASHHPERCHAVANLCVPYRTLDRGVDAAIALVDRSVYPQDGFAVGQWDYQLYYQENFARAITVFEASVANTIKCLFRKWSPDDRGKPAITAAIRRDGGWFDGADQAPDMGLDEDVISAADLAVYTQALEGSGFFGPSSFYMNHEANSAYSERSVNDGYLDMPVLFLTAAYDYVCECVDSKLPQPMRQYCRRLSEATVKSGHWMAQEKPLDVNNALIKWMATEVQTAWPEVPLS